MTEKFVYDVPVRWSDMDAFGHVNNARFLTLYEEARCELFFGQAHKHGLDSFEAGTVVARHEIDYVRPVDYGDPLRIEMWISELRVATINVEYELFDDGFLASRAKSVLVPYNLAAGRPRRLSEAEREFLLPYVITP